MKFAESNQVFKRIESKGIRINVEALIQIIQESELRYASLLESARVKNMSEFKALVTKVIAQKYPKHPKTASGKFSLESQYLCQLGDKIVQVYVEASSLQRKISSLKSYKTKALADPEHRLYPEHKVEDVAGRVYVGNFNYTNLAKEDRRIVLPELGQLIWEFDFNRAELMVLAVLSGDVKLLTALQSGDIHTIVACQIFGCSAPTDDQRQIAKTVNFSIIYGGSAIFLAKTLSVSEIEGQRYISGFQLSFPDAWNYILKLRKEGFRVKRAVTFFGNSKDFSTSPNPDRSCVSHRIQGTAGEITRGCLVEATAWVEAHGGFVKGSLFDSFVISFPEGEDPHQLKQVLEFEADKLGFPLKVSVKCHGEFWK